MAIADFAELGLEVVSTGVKEATSDLEKLATTAEKTEKATSGLSGGFKTSSDSALSFSEKAKALDSSLVNNLMSTFEKLQNPIIAFGAALIAAGTALAALGMKSISFADDMNDLAIATGKTFLELQTLGVIAEKNGTSMQAMQTLLDKVAVNMSKASSATSKQAEALKYFDVALTDNLGNRKTEAQLAYEVAAAYDKSNHSASATAAAQQLLTSNFREQLPAILALNTAQDESNKLKQYGAVVDKELASASDAYNDTLTDIGNILKGVGNDIARTLLPLLQSMADTFVDSATNGGILEGVLVALKVAFSVIVDVIKGVWSAIILLDAGFQAAGKTIGAFGAATAAVFSGNFTEARNIIKLLESDLAKLEQNTKQRLTSLWTDLKKTQDEVKKTGTGADGGNYNPNAAREAAAAAREAAKEYAELQKQLSKLRKEESDLEEQTRKLENAQKGIIDTDVALIKVINEYNSRVEELAATKKVMTAEEEKLWDAVAKAATELDKAREITDKTKIATKELNDELAAEEKLWKQKEAAINAINNAEAQYQQSLAGQVQSLEDSNRLLGLNAQQQKIVIEHKKIDAELSKTLAVIEKEGLGLASQALEEKKQAAIVDAQIAKDAVANAIKVGDAIKQQIADATTVWSGLGSVADNFFQDLLNNGTKSFKNLGEALKRWFIDVLYQLTVKKWIVNIVASGTASAAGVANAAGFGGDGGGLGGIFDSVLSAGSSLASSFSGIGMAVADFTQLVGQGIGVIDAFSMATSAAGLGLSSLVPVVGTIVAAGYMLYNFLESKRGGPKEGGFASSGATPGISGTDSTGRWMTPNQSDANMLTAVNQMTNIYNRLLNILGGTGSAVFAQGYSTDPKGTAPSNVHTGAWVNGSQIFDSPNGNVGRSSEELQAELELQSKRALLAALQASELPENIAEIIDSIAPETATAEAIDRVLALAEAIQQASDLLDVEPWKNLFANMNPEQVVELSEAFGGMNEMMGTVSQYMQLYYTDAERLAMSTQAMTDVFDAMGVQMPSSIEGFRALVEGIDKTTPAGAELFAQLMAIAPAFFEVQTAADEAAQAQIDAAEAASQAQIAAAEETARAAEQAAERMKAAAMSLLNNLSQLAEIQGGSGSSVMMNGLIDMFASGRQWATDLLASVGYEGFAANLKNITTEDFKAYSAADQELILKILNNMKTGNAGSSGSGSSGSYGSGNIVDVGSLYGNGGSGNNEAAAAAAALAKTQQLNIQLLIAEGRTREALNAQRELELAALSESDQAIQRRIWALQDEAAVTQATSDLKTRILQAQAALDQANGVQSAAAAELLAMQREKERAAMLAIDASLGPMLDSLYALEDELYAMQQAAMAAAAAAEQAATMMNLQIRLAQAQGNSEEVIRLQREAELAAAKTEEERQMLLAIYAAEDAARAAAAAAQAQQEAAAAAAQAQSQMQAAASAAQSAYEKQRQEIESQVNALDNLAKSTREYVKSLQEMQLAMTNPKASLAMTRAAFLSAKPENLQETGNKYLEAARENAGTRLDYIRAMAEVINVASAAAETAETEADRLAQQIGLVREGNASLEGIHDQSRKIFRVLTGQSVEGASLGGTRQPPITPGEQAIVGAIGGQSAAFAEWLKKFNELTGGSSGGVGTTVGIQPVSNSGGVGTTRGIQPIPGFASGGHYAGGYAIVGENGPELINFPHGGNIHPAQATSTMITQNKEIATALKELVKELMAGNSSISKNTEKTAKILQRFDTDGLPPERT